MTDTLGAALDAAMRPTSFTVKMTKDKTTKNTVVYKAPKGEYVDTLYIQQDAFRSHTNSVMSVFPDQILIVVQAV